MITRSAKKRNVHSECKTLVKSTDKSEVNVYRSALFKLSQSDIQLDKEKCQKSILNVHIQMPKCEIGNINLFVPGFQPVVHFHFNEEPKNLKVFVGKDNGEEGSKIQLYKSNLENENSLEFETKRLSRSYPGDIAGEDAIGIENNYKNDVGNNSNSKNCSNYKTNDSKHISNDKKFKNEGFEFNESISNWSLFKHDAKLTKAVVVVHDIIRKKDNQISRSQEKRNGNKVSKGLDVPLAKEDSVESSGQIIGSCSTNATHKTVDNKSLEAVNVSLSENCKILTKLAEGYNFSEILSRFRFNYGSCITDSSGSLKVIKSENSSESPVKGEGELEKTENSNESLVDDKNQGLKFRTSNLGEDLNKVGGLLAPSCEEIVESIDSGGSTLHGLVQSTKCRDSRKDAENLRDQFQDSDMKTDANESTTLVASGSGRIFASQETVDSSNVTSEVVDNENCNISEIGVNSNFGVITDEMEMKTKNVNKNNKLNKGKETTKKRSKSKTQWTKSSRSSRAKKMKESNEMPQKTLSKGVKSASLDYIPLQASGPTKFGVSMLNKILPFERHDARDFKNRMLFGERVTRYPSSQHMQMYKLKQEAVRHVKESSKK